MLHPAHSELLKSAILQAIHVLRDDRMLIVVGSPRQNLVADVARGRAHRIRADSADGAPRAPAGEIADNDIRSGAGSAAAGMRRRDSWRQNNAQQRQYQAAQ